MVPNQSVDDGQPGPTINELAHRIKDGKLTAIELYRQILDVGGGHRRATKLVGRVLLELAFLNDTTMMV